MHRSPEDARKFFLDRLATPDQARVIRTAEAIGPAPTDVDWLIAEATQLGADRMERAAGRVEVAIAKAVPSIDELPVDQLKRLLKPVVDNIVELSSLRAEKLAGSRVEPAYRFSSFLPWITTLALVVALASMFGTKIAYDKGRDGGFTDGRITEIHEYQTNRAAFVRDVNALSRKR